MASSYDGTCTRDLLQELVVPPYKMSSIKFHLSIVTAVKTCHLSSLGGQNIL